MRVARLTAASAHHLLDSSRSFVADTAIVLSPVLIYDVLVPCTYTLYKYVVHHCLYDV